jgi:hypothetical protein
VPAPLLPGVRQQGMQLVTQHDKHRTLLPFILNSHIYHLRRLVERQTPSALRADMNLPCVHCAMANPGSAIRQHSASMRMHMLSVTGQRIADKRCRPAMGEVGSLPLH